jgi:arylsulfatase A-like enzyme
MLTLGVQLGIGVWLVVASRLLTGTGVSISGIFDDLALVLLLSALQATLVRRARGVPRQLLAMLPITLAAAYFLANESHYAFFRTNLGIAAFQIGTMAIDARSSVWELLNFANVTALFTVPVVAQAALLRPGRTRMPAAAGPLLFSGLLAAGLAGLLRQPVFIFPDHDPAMSLAREAAERLREFAFGTPQLELEQAAVTLFNRDGFVGYEFAGSPERLLYQRPIPPVPEPPEPINVIVLLMESVRAFEMVGDSRRLPVTPFLNALEAQALVFPNFYYNGMRTIDAEFSLLCSALPLLNQAPIYTSHPRLDIRCLPEILTEHGYGTHWISGYRASYGNKAGFLMRHGVQRIHDDASLDPTRNRYPDVGWGMGDRDMFEQALEKLDRFQEPFFAEIMTLSNHHPFDHDYGIEFPASFDHVPGNQHYRNYLKGIHYTDRAIGEFLENARDKSWFRRTLFVILGDHSVRAYPTRADGSPFGPVRETEIYFRGRLILYGPEILEPGEIDRLGSQIDVAPTLLEILGIRSDNSFLGVSLLAPVPNDRRFALTNIGHLWNMRVGNRYCYSVGYSCFENVFPRCPKGVEPTFSGHTCFESGDDLLELTDESGVRNLQAVEREQVLERARKILEVNRTMVVDSLFR